LGLATLGFGTDFPVPLTGCEAAFVEGARVFRIRDVVLVVGASGVTGALLFG
jgi:hypothetical protein